MSLSALMTQSVEVIPVTQSATDEYGNPDEAEGAAVTYPAWLEQVSAREETLDRGTQITEWLLVLPAGAVIDGSDRVRADGVTYQVIGSPARPRTPRGEHHVECRLRTVSG